MKSIAKITSFLVLAAYLSLTPAFGNGEELGLDDFLLEAAKKHPELESAHWREEVANAQLDVNKSAIFPSIEAGPLVTRGGPGGSSVLGWNGNISANLRSGQGFAGAFKYTVWDFGRTSASVRAGVADVEFAQADTQRVKGETLLSLAHDYLECSRNRHLLGLLLPLKMQTGEISRTIEALVKTGQKTLVEAHLARAQTLEIETQIQIAQEKVQFHQKRLGTIIGRDGVKCLGLESALSAKVELDGESGAHPSILSARARAKAAQDRVDSAYAERSPRLQLFGNGGYFVSENLTNPWNYSVSAVLAIPIWDARTGAEIRKSEAAQQQAESDLRATALRVNSNLISAEERFRVTEVQVHSLDLEKREAIRGFEIARQRYKKSVGLLIELRETVRNLIRVSTAFSVAQADHLSARFLLNWYRSANKS
jgi:outer membrane protein TolC